MHKHASRFMYSCTVSVKLIVQLKLAWDLLLHGKRHFEHWVGPCFSPPWALGCVAQCSP